MSTKYKFKDQTKLYFVSFAVVYWIDVFIRNEYKEILLDSLSHCRSNKGLDIYAYCIMTSHVHLIIGTSGQDLQDTMRDLKSYTSKQLKKAIEENSTESRKEWMLWLMKRAGEKNSNNISFQFWQQDNHPIELTSYEIAKQKLDYIHNNPVEAGFVSLPHEYLYSSAKNYCGEISYFEVTLLDKDGE
jgi:putative transposase